MFRHHAKNTKGFTLVEVLIVVAIIGILTAILVANYNDARKNSRDKIRKSDLKTMQLSLELYKAQFGQYPAQGCGTVGSQWAGPGPFASSWGASCDDYIVGLAPDFVASLLRDPSRELESDRGYLYRTNADRSAYKLLAYGTVEKNMVTSYADEFARCPRDCSFLQCAAAPEQDAYAVYSAGAECW